VTQLWVDKRVGLIIASNKLPSQIIIL